MDALRRILQFLSVAALAFWLGGVVFYGAVVVPTAHETLRSHREIGFVTRVVTGTANLAGVATIALLGVRLGLDWRRLARSGRLTMAISLGVMLAAQVALILLRAHLDSMLDPARMEVLDRSRFMPLHERYLNVTGVLSLAGLVHLWMLLAPKPVART
jgi:hypothetical protein